MAEKPQLVPSPEPSSRLFSSGGSSPHAKVEVGPGYQLPFAARIRCEAGIMIVAVGMTTDGPQAEAILAAGDVDAVFAAA